MTFESHFANHIDWCFRFPDEFKQVHHLYLVLHIILVSMSYMGIALDNENRLVSVKT